MIREIMWNWLPWVYNKSIDVLNITNRVIIAVYTEIYLTNELLFLDSFDLPVQSKLFRSIPSETIRWRCQLNPIRFIGFESDHFKHISYLGFVISIPGYDSIDLTDWINDIQWSGLIEPTPRDIFIAWCYDKQFWYFHLLSSATVEIITETGDTISKGLNEFTHTTSSLNG
jgi:hypothetical protein